MSALVSISSTNPPEETEIAAARQSLKDLNGQRTVLDDELEAIVSELTAVNAENPTVPPMGMDTPLVDSDGYPRNDIDVYRARTLRGRLAVLKTNRTKLTRDMDALLQRTALLQKQQNNNNNNNIMNPSNENNDTDTTKPPQPDDEEAERVARLQAKPKPKYDAVSGKWVVRNWDGTVAGDGGLSNSGPRSFDSLATEVESASTPPFPEYPQQQQQQQPTLPVVELHPVPPAGAAAAAAVVAPSPIVFYAATTSTTTPTIPLARVDSVEAASPAAAAGLKPNDVILAFGPIHHPTDRWQGIADLVRMAAADHAMVELRIVRPSSNSNGNTNDNDSSSLLLRLEPRPWNGRGLLGCHIVPI